MPTINEVMERVARVRPDAYDDETKGAWLLELEGKLLREVIRRHRLRPMGPEETLCGEGYESAPEVCPICEERRAAGEEPVKALGEGIVFDEERGLYFCPVCGWTELPDIAKQYPEDGDRMLLVAAPYDRLYDLYLMAQLDFYNREMENYNNSVTAFNAALDEWRQSYHRRHLPLTGPGVQNLF